MFKIEWTKQHTQILVYTCGTILAAILLALVLLFPGKVFGLLGGLLRAISPVLIGLAIAYLLHPICRFFDKKVLKGLHKKKPRPLLSRSLAVLLTFLCVAAVIALFIGMIVPQIKASYLDLEQRLDGYLQKVTTFTEGLINELVENGGFAALDGLVDVEAVLDAVEGLVGRSLGLVGSLAGTIVNYSSKIVTVIANIIVSLIFAVYFLLQKEKLLGVISYLTDLLLPDKFGFSLRKWVSYTDKAFGSFIAGKLLNATMITLLNFVVFGLFDIPYYPLIALITGITDMIPYFGPFLGAIPSAFIILIADPIKVIWFVILVLVIQQLDGNLIGPKILGEKVGVDSLLIIVAITVGGGLFGVAGMFLGVPVFTVLQQAVREFTNNRLARKRLSTKTEDYGKKEVAKQ